MIGHRKNKSNAGNEYREVQVKPAMYTMLVIVAIVALPLGWLNYSIGAEGSEIADTTRYRQLVVVVNRDLDAVKSMLDNETVDERVLKGSLAPVVTLITPDNFAPIDSDESARMNNGKLKIQLSGIYWSPTDPIVTINDENYHVGEMVQNHRIVEIRKTEVVFEDSMGEQIIKNFYEYLGNEKAGIRQ